MPLCLKNALGTLGIFEGFLVDLAVVGDDQAQAGRAVGCGYDVGCAADGIQNLLCRVFVINNDSPSCDGVEDCEINFI